MLEVLPQQPGTTAYHKGLRSAITAYAAYRLASVFCQRENERERVFPARAEHLTMQINAWVPEENSEQKQYRCILMIHTDATNLNSK